MEAQVGNLSRDEAAELTGRLAGLTASGLALPDGLRALGAELDRPRLRRMFEHLARAIERGESLDVALDGAGGRFPADLRGLAVAAVRSGRVTEILGESARLQRLGLQLRRRIWLGLAYPFLLLSAFSALFLVLSVYVIGEFENIYADFGIDLPWMTIALLKVAHFFRDSGWILVVGPLLLWALATIGGLAIGARARRRVVGSIPLLGPLWRSTTMAEFSHLLALLVQNDVPLPEALSLAGRATRDGDVVDACEQAARDVEAGGALADSIERFEAFPPGFAALLRWAERGRSLPEALHVAGELFEARARPQASFLTTFVTIVVVFLVVFGSSFLMTALYLPLIRLISALSG